MSQCAGAGFDQQTVGVAVVAAGELDDLVAVGERPGQPDGAHAGLGAGADQPDRLHRWQRATDDLGQFDFLFHGRTEAGAALGSLLQDFNHRGMGVPQD